MLLLTGWNAPDQRPRIERDVYMVSAVVLPKADDLPDRASAPPPPRRGEDGKKATPPPRPDEMVLKQPDQETSEGEKRERIDEREPKESKPSRAELLASLDSEDDEFRFATDPDGDPEAPPDKSLKKRYGRQLTAYERLVRDAIQHNWFPKYAAEQNDETWTAIGFTIDDHGNIRDPQIDHSSGDFIYDQSCLRAVSRTRRVRPPPAGANRAISVGFSPKDRQ
jgi:TonB family protein